MQLDWSLITALVERWRPETHTFHLPTGEATIMLEDVQVLYGLRVDGRAAALPQYIRSMMRAQFLDMMMHFTDYRPQGDAGGSRVALSAIRDHMAFLHPDITDETKDLHIERYTRLALLLLFGCVLFPNTSGSKVSMRFLHHLQELDGLPQYSWGAAVLAYLYRSMCRFIWTPYNDELVAQLPFYCSVDRMLWSTSVPMIFFDMVEYHATERVLRQFHRPQPIPRDPGWVAIHYQRDDRARLDDIYMG
ncbi:serine/threonine-protein phosphatase 7 long form homolog [Nicotiana tabacum]|uniref:Serine/threonine-protein phosphatase 7 long form homolog n=1 Tax=Nicotiana tabacum TaxID=4097 RepID=A0AC58TQ39_TOBAC